MEDDIEACNTGLCLGLGMEGYVPKKKKKQRENNQVGCLDLPFELCPRGEETLNIVDHEEDGLFRLKRMGEGHQLLIAKSTDNINNCGKKLRLTKDQSALLEESFKLHTTLNPAQKQALAEQLNLRPRQVEVWFQNRRARTKFKQTEVDCEFLRKCCENLRDENRRLKKELQELRALKVGPSPLYIQLSKTATLAMCSSCEKPFKANEAKNNYNNSNHKLVSVAIES